ncbi:uncharacterized protein LOC104898483 [Beta vulgaris subsp. vulgaris]|uniref:uncharacterized protein LOC104898483 n=1 Tax=Beta vulgaris subsp. vulgaris TaxID=3555 RepID=UPI0005401AD3|nr:uncharacterized protein LOC104898483 [Beta vulgaris subsp. vulgaris]
MTTIEVTSPLYLHPSDGTNFIIAEKLQGSANYRPWRRSMEIALAAKRKLGFVTGVVKRESRDTVKAEAWDTCNNMIISWILNSVSYSIKKSVMFVSDAGQIWRQLEQRFTLTNGSRKYKLNKDLYEARQQGKAVSEYYTTTRCYWKELESLNSLPPITSVTAEVTAFVEALTMQKEEHKLFLFPNGLDEAYGTQRSKILMMTPLPSVETTCSYLEQEEARREILCKVKEERETLAMYIKGTPTGEQTGNQCSVWKGKNQFTSQYKGKGRGSSSDQKWNKGKQSGTRVAANVQGQQSGDNNSAASGEATITAQQLEQLLRHLPTPSKGGEIDDEMDVSYSGMVYCHFVDTMKTNDDWILDSGASDHMTGKINILSNVSVCKGNPLINLPTGEASKISNLGDVT